MTSRRFSISLICLFFLLFPLQVTAADSKGGYSPDVAAFMETDGMTVFNDPEIMAIQEKMAEHAKKENFTDGDTEKATALIDQLFASIERIAREYMSGRREANNPEHTVLDKNELPSCVDDGSCSKKPAEQPAKVSKPILPQRSYQEAQIPARTTACGRNAYFLW